MICVNAVATAASAAVPPALSTSTPAWTAIGDAVADTSPFELLAFAAALGKMNRPGFVGGSNS